MLGGILILRKIVTIMIIWGTSLLFAGGFQINEHGARAMALGNAFTAIANDASAVYWNAAGLSYLEGTQLILGTAMIRPSTSFRGVSPDITKYDMEKQTFFPSHFFITHTISSKFSIGAGVSNPFGLETKWEGDWIGRYLTVETALTTFSIPIVVSYAILPNLSISGGVSYNLGHVRINQKNSQTPFEGDADVELEGDDSFGFGYNFGLMWKANHQVSVGAAFRSQVKYTFEGTAKTVGAEQLAAVLPNGDIKANLNTPAVIQGGVAVQVIKQLLLSGDFQWVGWSSYDSLIVTFNDPEFERIARPRSYKDTYIIRFGAQYDFNEDVSILGGIYFDKNPVDPENANPSLPDSDRIGFSIGVDAKISEKFGLTASYLFVRASELTVSNSNEIYTPYDDGNENTASKFNGTYNSNASVLSLSFYYSFN
jgi:long-chain fatty acid transport protein